MNRFFEIMYLVLYAIMLFLALKVWYNDKNKKGE